MNAVPEDLDFALTLINGHLSSLATKEAYLMERVEDHSRELARASKELDEVAKIKHQAAVALGVLLTEKNRLSLPSVPGLSYELFDPDTEDESGKGAE